MLTAADVTVSWLFLGTLSVDCCWCHSRTGCNLWCVMMSKPDQMWQFWCIATCRSPVVFLGFNYEAHNVTAYKCYTFATSCGFSDPNFLSDMHALETGRHLAVLLVIFSLCTSSNCFQWKFQHCLGTGWPQCPVCYGLLAVDGYFAAFWSYFHCMCAWTAVPSLWLKFWHRHYIQQPLFPKRKQ